MKCEACNEKEQVEKYEELSVCMDCFIKLCTEHQGEWE